MDTPKVFTELASKELIDIVARLVAGKAAYWQMDARDTSCALLVREDTGEAVVIIYGNDDFEINDEYFYEKGLV